MIVTPHHSGAAFLAAAQGFLEREEAVHGLLLGLAESCDDATFSSWTVERERGGRTQVLLAALRIGERKLLLSGGDDEAAGALAAELRSRVGDLPGAHGPRSSVRAFGSGFARAQAPRLALRAGMRMRVHRCTQVSSALPRCPGRARLARSDESARLERWGEGFAREIGNHDVQGAQMVRAQIARRRLWVWEHEGVKSMCAWSRPTKTGVSVNAVFTPSEQRGRGYATAVVAALTRERLGAGGRGFCCLYTDLDNPTSNAIYARIGYAGVEDFEDWWFGG